MAKGSLCELETHLVVAQRLSLLAEGEVGPLIARITEIGKMLSALSRKLGARVPAGSVPSSLLKNALDCHPERSAGSASCRKSQEMQIPRRLRRLGMTSVGVFQQAART